MSGVVNLTRATPERETGRQTECKKHSEKQKESVKDEDRGAQRRCSVAQKGKIEGEIKKM